MNRNDDAIIMFDTQNVYTHKKNAFVHWLEQDVPCLINHKFVVHDTKGKTHTHTTTFTMVFDKN